MASSFQRERIPAVIKGHRHFSYGGAVLPESVTIKQYYELTPTKKSNLRFNDQLLPKPTDINISEWMIKAVVPKEHPYQSHIPRYAMFPSYKCPDDPHTGVRAASTLPLNPQLPSSAPAVTVLHKTKGSPYRHEILDVPMATEREAHVRPGQCGFHNTKPLNEDAQVLYPKPVKTVCPSASLRNWNSTLSERSVNILRNLEKAQWLTSYQLQYTGTGPSNPIKLDDFHEKTIAVITGEMNPLTTQLRERSFPTFIPSRPLEGRKARVLQNRNPLKRISAQLLSPPATSALPGTADLGLDPPKTAQQKDRVIKSNEIYDLQSERSDLRCAETDYRSFDENVQTMKSQLEKRNNYLTKGLQPRSVKEAGTDLQPRSTLLELQDFFRKSEAHACFHQSIKDKEVDLRDNHCTGRKHVFCGFNSYYFHN